MEKYCSDLLHSVGLFLCRCRAEDSMILQASGAWNQLLELPKGTKSILGKELLPLIPDGELKRTTHRLLAVELPTRNCIISLRNGDGNARRFRLDAIPHPQTDGGVVDLLLLELSESSQAEEALQESEEWYRRIVETATEGIWLLDDEARTVFVNRKTGDILGYSGSEMIEKTFYNFVPEEWQGKAKHHWKLDREGKKQKLDFKLRHRDGTDRWVIISASPIFDSAGTYNGSLGMLTDITERKKAEEELRREEERLAVTLEAIADAVISVDTNDRIVMMNRVAAELTGYDRGEASGKVDSEVLDILCQATSRQLEHPVREFFESKHTEHFPKDVVLTTSSGEKRYVSPNASRILDRAGNPMGYVLALHDMTRERRMQKELAKTRKLESLAALASGIAHDFNNILTGIVGNLSLCQLRLGSADPIQVYVREAENICLDAQTLTNQLLDFAERGTPVLQRIRPESILESKVKFALSGSTVKGEFDIADDLWAVNLDKSQIAEVFNNLTLNAKHAMKSGGRLKVQAANVELGPYALPPLSAGKYIKISFTDTGEGVTPENLAKVFDPYFSTRGDKAGLGLSTAHTIVRNHGGLVTAHSKIGKGTTLAVYLPVAEEPESPVQPSPSSNKIEESAATATGNGHLLLMDDEEYVSTPISAYLEQVGYEVETVKNGEEAIRAVEQSLKENRVFDLLILDLTIAGGMGGVETLAKVREMLPEVLAIVSSGYAESSVVVDYKNFGFNDSIVKPFNLNELCVKIQSLINQECDNAPAAT